MFFRVMAMNLQTARDKARVKQAILRELSSLPRGAQEDVLADIVLTFEDEDGLAPPDVKPQETPIQEQLPMPTAPVRTVWKARVKKRRGRPQRGEGRTAAVEAALRSNPGITITGLTKLVYPDEEDATHRVRAILWSLKRQGRAINPQPGKWEVTAQAAQR